jgi:amidophosphoribosyltransferase
MWADTFQEECGVFGIYAPREDVARLTFMGLHALQHRGQESAGIVVSDGEAIRGHKGLGLVTQVFQEAHLGALAGSSAIGHTRYATAGGAHVRNAQPFTVDEPDLGPFALAHNGHVLNIDAIRRTLRQHRIYLNSSSDTLAAAMLLTIDSGSRWDERIAYFMQQVEGAYSLAILTCDALYAVRDPLGLRPLCLGRLDDRGWVVASESCALTTVGATLVREIEPGEIVAIDANGPATVGRYAAPQPALCAFEYIYFARADSQLQNQSVHAARMAMGRELAREAPIDADIVIGVPESAIPAALGYAQESGLPYAEGLVKNRYVGRTFIQPTDRLRKQAIALKYHALPSTVRGKRVVLVDDSIVRGHTSGPIVRLLRDAGAAEVHLRIASPPVRHPCFMGLDLATYGQLIAHHMSEREIALHVDADSLKYLSLDGMLRGIGRGRHGFCTACFSGSYPFADFVPEVELLAA